MRMLLASAHFNKMRVGCSTDMRLICGNIAITCTKPIGFSLGGQHATKVRQNGIKFVNSKAMEDFEPLCPACSMYTAINKNDEFLYLLLLLDQHLYLVEQCNAKNKYFIPCYWNFERRQLSILVLLMKIFDKMELISAMFIEIHFGRATNGSSETRLHIKTR